MECEQEVAMFRRHLTFIAALALATPTAAWAATPQIFGQFPVQFGSHGWEQSAYREGYDRGLRAGRDDLRRGDSYRYEDESDYRRADYGYRSEYGNRDRYRDEFRRGYEVGYRTGYGRFDSYSRLPPNRDGRAPWAEGRAYGRFDLAAQNGFNDGYDAGLRDARDRHRLDPLSERRYRSGDHGYERSYGSKDRYKLAYRDAFRDGYDQGYREGASWSGGRR
jgi:hypothetical protein